MADKFQFRYFDYVLRIPSLPANSGVLRYPLTLDTDSSFILRGRAVHTKLTERATLESQQTALAGYLDRFTGPDQDDLADGLTRFSTQSQMLGQFGLPLPVRPPMVYPAGSTIYVDVQNDGADALTNLEVYFRGQKIFAPGTLPCKTYPPSCFARPYWFPKTVNLTIAQISLNNILQVNPYADFVLRTLAVGSFDLVNSYRELQIQLRDMDGRAYSNLPVNVETCFGAYGSVIPPQLANLASGNNLPPLAAPEIYIPATQLLVYDLYRDDAGGGTVDVRLAFGGAQVWTR